MRTHVLGLYDESPHPENTIRTHCRNIRDTSMLTIPDLIALQSLLPGVQIHVISPGYTDWLTLPTPQPNDTRHDVYLAHVPHSWALAGFPTAFPVTDCNHYIAVTRHTWTPGSVTQDPSPLFHESIWDGGPCTRDIIVTHAKSPTRSPRPKQGVSALYSWKMG